MKTLQSNWFTNFVVVDTIAVFDRNSFEKGDYIESNDKSHATRKYPSYIILSNVDFLDITFRRNINMVLIRDISKHLSCRFVTREKTTTTTSRLLRSSFYIRTYLFLSKNFYLIGLMEALLSITKAALFLSFIHSLPSLLFSSIAKPRTTLDHVIFDHMISDHVDSFKQSTVVVIVRIVCIFFCNRCRIGEPYVHVNTPYSSNESSLVKSSNVRVRRIGVIIPLFL